MIQMIQMKTLFNKTLLREHPPESPTTWTSTLQRSSGSVSTTEETVVTVGETEVKLRKSRKKKKRSSMIFITEETERTSTLLSKRVRMSTNGLLAAAHGDTL